MIIEEFTHNKRYSGFTIRFQNRPSMIYTYDYLLTRMNVDPLLKTLSREVKENIQLSVFREKNAS